MDQSTEAQETTEVFSEIKKKKTQKTTAYRCQQIGPTEQGKRDPNGEDSWELSEPTDGSQGLVQGGRREGGTASSMLFLWESEAGSTADAVTHGGILPGIINLALLTAL